MAPVLPLFDPPLLNSASLWASTEDELRALYLSQHTGAVTTRTALLNGFEHDDSKHRHVFFSTSDSGYQTALDSKALRDIEKESRSSVDNNSSINTLGYSPFSLSSYIKTIRKIEHEIQSSSPAGRLKPVIFSITGTAAEVGECLNLLSTQKPAVTTLSEINLSCPNIPNAPPPAYSIAGLREYLAVVKQHASQSQHVLVGLKLPPYTHAGQFKDLIDALDAAGDTCPVSFLTSTNTLGTCMLFDQNLLPEIGPGGMAGSAIHPLALGNVATLRRMLDERPRLRGVRIIGVGGVSSVKSYGNMRAAGAEAVAVATALGRNGIQIFATISGGES